MVVVVVISISAVKEVVVNTRFWSIEGGEGGRRRRGGSMKPLIYEE